MTISKPTLATVGLSIGVFFAVVGMSPYLFVPEHVYVEVGPENQALINAYIEPVRLAKKASEVEGEHDSEVAVIAAAGHWCDLYDRKILQSIPPTHADDTSANGVKQSILRNRDALVLRLMNIAEETKDKDPGRSAAVARLGLRLTYVMRDSDLNSMTLSLSQELRLRKILADLGSQAPPLVLPTMKRIGALYAMQASLEDKSPEEKSFISVASAISHYDPSSDLSSPEWQSLQSQIGKGQPSRMLARHVLLRLHEMHTFDRESRLVKK